MARSCFFAAQARSELRKFADGWTVSIRGNLQLIKKQLVNRYAWLNESWTLIPPEKIIRESSPNRDAFLFVLAGTIQCFVPPKGGV
jgi:hypothetical protein